MIDERAFFFGREHRPLYGVRYRPAAAAASSARRGVVICNSLFEEKFWCERVFANLGRHLAGNGFDVLVFDYYGYGNSAGDSLDVDVQGLDRDVEVACDLLAGDGAGRITLVGVRWGGVLACRAARRHARVDSVFLINPIAKWKSEFMKALRANVAGQYAIFRKTAMTRDEILEELTAGSDCIRSGYRMNNIDGYYFSKEFCEQTRDMTLPVDLPACVKKVYVVSIPEKPNSPVGPADKMIEDFRAAGVPCEGFDCPGDNAFWINHDIFTSVNPRLNGEISERLALLDGGTESGDGRGERTDIPVFESWANDGVRETAVSFQSGGGHRLYGVMYTPEDGGSKDLAFVFSHGGLIGMNGAYRFYTRGARRFAKAGYPSLCFDPHGMGRAQGTIENKDRLVLFREINLGLLADDVGDAVSFFRDRIGDKQIGLFGVCGGAITNLIAQGRFEDIDVSFQLSTPVMLPSLRGGIIRMSPGYAKFFLGMYAKKIINPKAWWRFVTFQSDYERIFKALKAVGRGALQRAGIGRDPSPGAARNPGHTARGCNVPPHEDTGTSQPTSTDDLRFNHMHLESYRKIIGRGGKIVYFYGENDNFKWEFQQEFAAKFPGELEAGRGLVWVEEIKQANHMYTLREWQDQIFEFCVKWAGEAAGTPPHGTAATSLRNPL